MNRQEILKAIRVCAKKLGRNPNLRELRRLAGINETELYRKMGNLKKALTAAGLKAGGSGFYASTSELLLDWAAVARKLGKMPTTVAYDQAGHFSAQPFFDRFGSWKGVGPAFRKFAATERIERRWKDVMKIIERQEERLRTLGKGRGRRKCPLMMDRAVYGDPLLMPGMAHAPTNEAGVMFAFGVMAARLGFVVKRWQVAFPDCVAIREMAKGQWQDQNVEVEFESKNFLRHGHDPKKCDVIVCWVHNWPECPEWIEVVELRKEIAKIAEIAKIENQRRAFAADRRR